MITTLSRCTVRRLSTRYTVLTVSSPAVSSFRIFDSASSHRCMSSDSGKGKKGFRPRRRSNKNYRPVRLPKKVVDEAILKSNANNPLHDDFDPMAVDLGSVKNPKDELEESFGPLGADVLRDVRQEIARKQSGIEEDEFEEELRLMDYLTAETGSTEDLVGERRTLAMDMPDVNERREFVEKLEAIIEEEQQRNLMGPELDEAARQVQDEETRDLLADAGSDENEGEMDHETFLDPNQLAHGEWSEMLVKVDRTTKLWRGGRLESYRALVIGGNLNGCGGFGIGKSADPLLAVDVAGRMCKRNIFFVDRYQGNGLTRDLVGKQNSCKVMLRATDNGLRGNELIAEILKRFGITNCVGKSVGNRNPYNVVRATFKALMTHESIEEIALKRGKRIVSIDRAMRMQV